MFKNVLLKLLSVAIFSLASAATPLMQVAHAALPTLDSASVEAAPAGFAFSRTLTFRADPPLQAASISNLPAGVSVSQDVVGKLVISGSVEIAGNYAVTATASNAEGAVNIPLTLGIFGVMQGATAFGINGNHGCAVVDGGLQCWGNRGEPTQAVLPAGSGVTALAYSAGTRTCVFQEAAICRNSSHYCAIVENGVQCWGNNSAGQLGGNNLSLITNVTAIAAGAEHTCAVASGGLQCWGANNNGQLGDGTKLDRAGPVGIIPPGSGVTAVAAGAAHTCAIVAGKLQCWGYRPSYLREAGNDLLPVQIAQLGEITSVVAGGGTTCVVKNGGVYCSSNPDVTTKAWSTNIAEGSGATALAVLDRRGCAVVQGRLSCWGYNELGDEVPPYGGDGVTAVALARDRSTYNRMFSFSQYSAARSCAIVAGSVRCWGVNPPVQVNCNVGPARICSPINYTGTNLVWQVAVDGRTPTVLRRMYNRQLETYTYTTNAGEYAALSSSGWVGDGEVGKLLFADGKVFGRPVLPLYRLYNPDSQRYLLSTNADEYAALGVDGWQQEGIVGYMTDVASNTPNLVTLPFFRLYNHSLRQHLYTTGENEASTLATSGWTNEGVIGYLLR